MTFKLENKYISGFVNWFGMLGDLTAKQARMRGRFLTILVAQLNHVADSHKNILVKYSKKDENGKPATVVVDGIENYDIPQDQLEAFRKDDQELLDEVFALDVTAANSEMFETVKDLVINTQFTFGPKETDSDQVKQQKIAQMNDYDTWCNAFETAQ